MRVHVCWYLCMHTHEFKCARKHTLIQEQPGLVLWETGAVLSSCCVNILGTLTHQLEIPLARMFSWGIFNGEFAIFPPTKDHSYIAVIKMHLKTPTQGYPKLLSSVRLLWARTSHSQGWKSPGWRCLCHTIFSTVCILSHPRSKCVFSQR